MRTLLIMFFVFIGISPILHAKTIHQIHNHHYHHQIHHHRHHIKKLHAPVTLSVKDFIPSTECRDPALSEVIDSSPNISLTDSVKKQLVDFVGKTVATLRYTTYKLGGKRFDSEKGVYVVDCSGFVDHVLKETSPHAYSSLVSATGADTPASQHYYSFFTELSTDGDNYWSKIKNVDDLRAGDILVFRYKNRRGIATGGHVMVVMNKPLRAQEVFLVRVADSAPTRHSEDTRPGHHSGIGIGTLLLKANSRTGQPAAYAWGLGGFWNKNVSIAMARPLDVG